MARHHALVDRKLKELIHRQTASRILLINEPPRHGKSEHVSHWLPAWFSIRYPNDYCGLASYASEFAKSWGLKSMQSAAEAGKHFGYRLDRRKQAGNHWGFSGYKGGMRTGGIRSGWSGKGFRLLILDDLLKDDEEAMSETLLDKQWDWFRSTARSRLKPDGVMVVMATRWTQKDICGRILDGGLGAGWPYEHVNLPAIAEENDQLGRRPGEALWPEGGWTADVLSTYREGDGTRDYFWQALYQQRPTQHQWAAWPDEYFEGVYADEWPEYFELSTVAGDPSQGEVKGDYGAGVFVGLYNQKIYVDADIERYDAPSFARAVINLAMAYIADEISFEANGFQRLLAGDFEDYCEEAGLLPLPIELIHNYQTSKKARIHRLGGWLRGKKLLFKRGSPGVERLLAQLRAFPMGDYDDGPDALEMAIRRLNLLAKERQAA